MKEDIMHKFWIVALVALPVVGCGAREEVKKEQKGIEINAPGVQIKINEDEGVNVKAPGAEVKANKEGVKVKAPRTDVEINREEGVDVSAPGADVKVKPGE
jgi:phage gp45-like